MRDNLSDQPQDAAVDALPAEPDAFVYFVDPAELAVMKPGWPPMMRLLLCMDAGGLCEFVVFHDHEENAVLHRVSEILDRPIGAFAISPEIDGHPYRGLLFSEENALLKTIQRSDSLQETAADYLINYNFAQEEGLDFDKLMRVRQPDADHDMRVNTDKIFAFGSKPARKKRVAPSGPPEGYATTDIVVPNECFYISLEMWLVGGRIRIANSFDTPLPMVPTLARDIAFRDDFTSVYMPRNMLPSQWRPKDKLVIDIPIEAFPAGFGELCGRRKVQMAVMPRGLFIEFGAVIPDSPSAKVDTPQDDYALRTPKPNLRSRLSKSFHIPLMAIAGLGVTGLFGTMITQPTTTDTANRTEPAMGVYSAAMPTQP